MIINVCYIHIFEKYLNPIDINPSRITKEDIKICKELVDEHDFDFEDVSLGRN